MLNKLKNLEFHVDDFLVNFFGLLITIGLIHLFMAVTSYVFNEDIATCYLIAITFVAYITAFRKK